MNPFTRSLIEQLNDADLAAFVERWDALESLVITVYRAGKSEPPDERAFSQLQQWLSDRYSGLKGDLTASIPEANSADPFELLLGHPSAESFIDNWHAMQTLPNAREALNNYIIRRIQDRKPQHE